MRDCARINVKTETKEGVGSENRTLEAGSKVQRKGVEGEKTLRREKKRLVIKERKLRKKFSISEEDISDHYDEKAEGVGKRDTRFRKF